MSNFIDITGQIFGELTVLQFDSPYWICNCNCGKSTKVRSQALRTGSIKSCGCKRYQRRAVDLTGQRFGKLSVICRRGENDKFNGPVFVCKCDCGSTAEIGSSNLRDGTTKSCGCLKTKHGHSSHDFPNSPTYITWAGMKARCNNPDATSYDIYGGRGILVCQRWNDDFSHFFADMGKRPEGTTLDRVNNNGRYEPSNCRWVTQKDQFTNSSSKTNKHFQPTDVQGQKFGQLTVISIDIIGNGTSDRATYWNCLCECGKTISTRGTSLRSGHAQSCGCSKNKSKASDLAGQRFGMLIVISRDKTKKNRAAYWSCKCDCGKIKSVRGGQLRSGQKSCGCGPRNCS